MHLLRAAFCAAFVCASATVARAQGSLLPLPQDQPIRGATMPSLSPDGKMLCFTYLGDLWTVPTTGGTATRLTVHEAHDGYSHWSPDGRWIAFASDRYNTAAGGPNYDVFLVPAEGGPARQLTYNTVNDFPTDWSPDGTRVLFNSVRGTDSLQEYEVDIRTGAAKTLTDDDQFLRYGVYSPDGKRIAYDRSGGVVPWWRPRYHGSANMDIYVKDIASGHIDRVTDYDGMDMWPMYSADGARIFYVTDQLTPGTPNLAVRAAAGSGSIRLLTHHKGDAVRYPGISRDGSAIAYMYDGDLWVVDTKGGAPRKLAVFARSDDKQNMIQRLALTNGATEVEISPDGKTLALVVRGDIWTVPADQGGEAKRLTTNPANDMDILWSPDSARLALISDRSGNFNVYVLDVKTGQEKRLSTDGHDENMPQWSPDGKSVSFLRSGPEGGIYVVPSDGSAPARRLAESQGNNIFGVGVDSYAWSPDGRWIAFSRRDRTNTNDVWVVPAAGGTETNVTFWPGENSDPAWTSDGKYLLFLSDRDQGTQLYSVPLQKEKQETDEKKAEPTKPAPAAPAGAKPADAKPAEPKKPVEVKIDLDDIENRAKKITTQGAGPFQVTPDGKSAVFIAAQGGPPDYWAVPVNGGAVQRLTTTGEGTGLPRFQSDGTKFYALGTNGTAKWIARAGGAATQVAFTARLELDRRAEIAQAFNEFWRRINVGFYDPNMHGVDWRAVRARYQQLLPAVATKEEFSSLLSMMVGELNASHSEVGFAPGPPGASTADLGLTFDENYGGPGLKVTGYMPEGPDDDLGPKIKVGEYILQIDGEDVRWNEALWNSLLGKADKTVELLVNSKAAKDGARTVKLKAISTEQWRNLEYDRKVKEARERVDRLSGGRLAYIHIRGMDRASQRRMERELWGKALTKDGLVLDIRDNGGGNTHDDILAQLSRVSYGFTQPRDGARSTQPFRHWDKPIILLINQGSASDAEIFPYGFRQLKLGKIVGVATPGYVIGTYDGRLQDGTSYRVPMWGWLTPDGKDMENNGCRPDITVELTAEDIAAKRDRQLEVAVDTLLKELPAKK